MNNIFDPSEEQIAKHVARKAQYMAAKMGLIYLCGNCYEEIYLTEKSGFISDCSMPRWFHKDNYGKRYACYNDESDGVAYPMDDLELEDLYDDIARDDWWYSGNEDE
jgi:hypothetical protein